VSPNLDRDLAAWERGELPRESLVARHGAAAAQVVAVHDRIVDAVASTPIPGVEAGWAALLLQLDTPGASVVPIRSARKRGRVVALAVAAALLLAGSALAVAGPRANEDAPIAPTMEPSTGFAVDLGHVGPFHGSGSTHGFSSATPPSSDTHPGTGSGGGSGTDGSGEGSAGGQAHPSGANTNANTNDGTHPGQGNDGEDNGNDQTAPGHDGGSKDPGHGQGEGSPH
jgi:hypothetical protein